MKPLPSSLVCSAFCTLLLSLTVSSAQAKTSLSHLLMIRGGASRSMVPSGMISDPNLDTWGGSLGFTWGIGLTPYHPANRFSVYLTPLDISLHLGAPASRDTFAGIAMLGLRAEVNVYNEFFVYLRGSGGAGMSAGTPVYTGAGGLGVGYRWVDTVGLTLEPFSVAWLGNRNNVPEQLIFQFNVGVALFLN